MLSIQLRVPYALFAHRWKRHHNILFSHAWSHGSFWHSVTNGLVTMVFPNDSSMNFSQHIFGCGIKLQRRGNWTI